LRSRILKCTDCGSYTLKANCPKCGIPTVNTYPPRFSPEDKYGKYRRMYYQENADSNDPDKEE